MKKVLVTLVLVMTLGVSVSFAQAAPVEVPVVEKPQQSKKLVFSEIYIIVSIFIIVLLHEFPACDKSGIFLVKLFLDDIRKIIKKSLVHNNCRFYLCHSNLKR